MILQRVLCRAKANVDLRKNVRQLTSINTKEEKSYGKMKSWQVHSYGDELQLTDSRIPFIKNPDDVIVQVQGSSVNPIDLAMLNGYASVGLNFVRQIKECTLDSVLEFPLTLGRDFAGVIIQKGLGVKGEYAVGDEVWGIVPIEAQGSHAEEVLVPKHFIYKKPKNISMVEAGSMLYAAMTAWCALKITAGLILIPSHKKNVLVLGASGGVGTMAVQMLSSWGATVTATCSTDAIPLLESLGVMDVIDYKGNDYMEKIQKNKYDVILDCAGIGHENLSLYLPTLKDYTFSKYVTLKSPAIKNIDEYGLLGGMLKNVADLAYVNVSSGVLPKFTSVRWGFILPVGKAFAEITEDVSKGKIIPCIQKTYSFNEIPAAYEHVQAGHLRGKIALDMKAGQ